MVIHFSSMSNTLIPDVNKTWLNIPKIQIKTELLPSHIFKKPNPSANLILVALLSNDILIQMYRRWNKKELKRVGLPCGWKLRKTAVYSLYVLLENVNTPLNYSPHPQVHSIWYWIDQIIQVLIEFHERRLERSAIAWSCLSCKSIPWNIVNSPTCRLHALNIVNSARNGFFLPRCGVSVKINLTQYSYSGRKQIKKGMCPLTRRGTAQNWGGL